MPMAASNLLKSQDRDISENWCQIPGERESDFLLAQDNWIFMIKHVNESATYISFCNMLMWNLCDFVHSRSLLIWGRIFCPLKPRVGGTCVRQNFATNWISVAQCGTMWHSVAQFVLTKETEPSMKTSTIVGCFCKNIKTSPDTSLGLSHHSKKYPNYSIGLLWSIRHFRWMSGTQDQQDYCQAAYSIQGSRFLDYRLPKPGPAQSICTKDHAYIKPHIVVGFAPNHILRHYEAR